MVKEEPQYRNYGYICPHCKLEYKMAGSVRKHPDHQICPICQKKPNEANEGGKIGIRNDHL